MDRRFLAVMAVLAFAGLVGATENPTANTTHVMARIEFDNTVKEVNASLSRVKKEVASSLCGVPEKDVTIVRVMDDSTTIAGVGNTQTLVYAACKVTPSNAEEVLDDCEDMWNRHQLKDETADKTSWWSGGELDVDDIKCQYVEGGEWEFFSSADATKAAEDAAKKASGAGAAAAAPALVALAAGAAAMLL